MLLVAGPERLLVYNSSAHLIWRALAEGRTASEITATLAATFGLEPEDAAAHVNGIVAHWRGEGLLDAAASTATPAPDASEAVAGETERHWAARWTCRVGERLVEFAVEEAATAESLTVPLRLLALEAGAPETRIEVCAGGGGTTVVLRDGVERRRSPGSEGLKEAVYQTLVEFLWPQHPIVALMHAGVVARDQIACCFPGVSGSGKSTLIAYLCGRGFQFLSDDLAALAVSGEVLPLPVPISVKEGSWALVDHWYPQLRTAPVFSVRQTAARLITPVGAASARPTPLRALIFPRYAPGTAATLQRVRPLEALVRLREAGVWMGHPLTGERVAWFAGWLETTGAYALTYERLAEAAACIEHLVGGPGAPDV